MKRYREPGNQMTVWEIVETGALGAVTLEVVQSMGLMGRRLTLSAPEFKARFVEAPGKETAE